MSMSLFYNTTDSPVVIDDKGHIVGGQEWCNVKKTPEVERLLERGVFVVVDDVPDDDDPSTEGDTEPPTEEDVPTPVHTSKKSRKSRNAGEETN